jgi:hypothetical protein
MMAEVFSTVVDIAGLFIEHRSYCTNKIYWKKEGSAYDRDKKLSMMDHYYGNSFSASAQRF